MLRRHAVTIPILLALLAGLAVLALPSQASAAKKPCWERVVDDWLADGRIDGQYSTKCYQQALKNLPEDLRDYSDVADQIAAAMQNTLGRPPGSSTGGGETGGSNGDGPNAEKPRELQSNRLRSPYRRAIDNLGTTSSDSLPIPLLVLAGLGTALLVSAGGLAAAKRIRTRKPPA